MSNKFLIAITLLFVFSGSTAFADECSSFENSVTCSISGGSVVVDVYNNSLTLIDDWERLEGANVFNLYYTTPVGCGSIFDAVSCIVEDTNGYFKLNDVWYSFNDLNTANPTFQIVSDPFASTESVGSGFFAGIESNTASFSTGLGSIVSASTTSIWPVLLVVIGTIFGFEVLYYIQELIMRTGDKKFKQKGR